MNLNIDAKTFCFADETIIFIQGESLTSLYKANLVFKKIKLWFDNNFLELNLEKTKHTIFSIQKEIINNNFKFLTFLFSHSTIDNLTQESTSSNELNESTPSSKRSKSNLF